MTEAFQAVLCFPGQYRQALVEPPLEGPLIPVHQHPGRLQPDPWILMAGWHRAQAQNRGLPLRVRR